MGQIIFFDSARKGGTGKSKISVNTAVTMAMDSQKILLIEADYTNPNYISTYKQFLENDENKNSYEWFKDVMSHRAKKTAMKNRVHSELKKKLKEQLKAENPNLTDVDLEAKANSVIEEKTSKETEEYPKKEPQLENYVQKTKIDNMQVLIGKKNQNDLLEQIVLENKGIFRVNPIFIENRLKDDFIKNVRKLSKEYDSIIIDGYAGYDYLTRKLFGIADKHVMIAENNKASVESVYNNMYDTINKIFALMINRNPVAYDISEHYNISTANKTGIKIYDEVIEKAKEVHKELTDYELKKCRKEPISEAEEEIYQKFNTNKDIINALIEESNYRKDNLTTLCIVINKVNADIFGKQRDLAIKNYNSLKNGFQGYGIRAITPGIEKNSDAGIIYYYKDFYKEDTEGMPLAYLNPNHDFSSQIKNLASFIKSDECWRKEQ